MHSAYSKQVKIIKSLMNFILHKFDTNKNKKELILLVELPNCSFKLPKGLN